MVSAFVSWHKNNPTRLEVTVPKTYQLAVGGRKIRIDSEKKKNAILPFEMSEVVEYSLYAHFP